MAVQIFNSDLMVNVDKKPPLLNPHNRSETHLAGHVFTMPATTIIGDATSRIRLCQIPAGGRYIAALSSLHWSAIGAGTLLSLGWERFRLPSGVFVAEDVDGLGLGLNVAAAGGASITTMPTGLIREMEFPATATLIAVITGGVVPVGAILGGTIVYGIA